MKVATALIGTLLLSSSYLLGNCTSKFKDHIVHYADEHNPENRIITINYDKMKLLDLKDIPGDTNHHADVMGKLDKAHYMMLVPKGSYFVHFYDLKNNNFVKKIRLPFRPRSADAYNEKYNLVLLNSRDRPAGVLIDVEKLKIVGKAGFNIKCSQDTPLPLSPKTVYDTINNFDPNFKCLPIDFGGDQISGHPIWISSESFVLIDRANRLLHVYKIKKREDGEFDTKLIQTLKTDTSLHQLIPKTSNKNNRVFYGMTEGNAAQNLVAGVYKYVVKNHRLKKIKFRKLAFDGLFGVNGHNLYITPDKKYLYAPAGATLQQDINTIASEDLDWVERNLKNEKLKKSYKRLVKLFLRKAIKDNEVYDYEKVKKLFRKFAKQNDYTPKRIPSLEEYIATNFSKNITFIPEGAIYVVNSKNLRVEKRVQAGKGAGHVAFSTATNVAIVTNHLDDYMTAIDFKEHKFLKNINLNFEHENIFNLSQSHMQYVSKDGKYYYNFWSDGGVFYRINLAELDVDSSIYVGGIPIQGNFYETINQSCDSNVSADDGFEQYFEGDSAE